MISSSLFHFTKKKSTLIKIIKSGSLRAAYNIEDVSDFYPNENHIAIPMVCFCDIPLKFIDIHTEKYGKWGIGLKKEWGIEKKINPLLYRTENVINKNLQSIIDATQNIPEYSNGTYTKTLINDNVIKITNYSKKYEQDNIINYLDREWRYVPERSDIPFMKSKNKKEINTLNVNYFKNKPDFVPFTLKDIKYIIAPDKSEADSLVKAITNLKISTNKKIQLCQLIIDLKSINIDF